MTKGVDTEENWVPEVSVIVVNYNGGAYLRGCMASLAVQTLRRFEVILVDNASSDASLDLIDERPEHLVVLRETENHGFAKGNNLGVQRARGRWIALLNPDAEASPDWLEALLRAVRERPTYRVVSSLQVSMSDAGVLDGTGDNYLAYGYAWRGGYGRPLSNTPPSGECFAPCGAAAFFPREKFLKLGGFDEQYFCYHEDVDLGFRLRLSGERCQFDPRCKVRHAGSAISGLSSPFAIYHGVRNGVWTYVKNMPGPLLLVTAPIWFCATLSLLLRALFLRRFKPTIGGLIAGLEQIGDQLDKRREIKKIRRVGMVDIGRILCWNPLTFLLRKHDVRPFPDDSGEG